MHFLLLPPTVAESIAPSEVAFKGLSATLSRVLCQTAVSLTPVATEWQHSPLENAPQETVNKWDDDLRHAQYENAADDEGSKGKREILKLGPNRLK